MWMAREDQDVLFMAGSVGMGAGVWSFATYLDMGQAVAHGLMAASGTSGLVYFIRSLMHATPDVMEATLSVMAFAKQATVLRSDAAVRPLVERRETPRSATREERWRVSLKRFLTAGRLIQSYSMRQMAYDRPLADGRVRKRFVTETGWRQITEELQKAEVLAAGNGGTRLLMDYGQAVFCVKHTLKPPGREPPEVWLGVW